MEILKPSLCLEPMKHLMAYGFWFFKPLLPFASLHARGGVAAAGFALRSEAKYPKNRYAGDPQ